MQKYYTVAEVQELLGITSRSIYYWKNKGLIKFLKVGKKSVISQFDFDKLKKQTKSKILENGTNFYTIKKLAMDLDITETTVSNWQKRGLISYIENGNGKLIPAEDVDKIKKELGYDLDVNEYYTVKEFSRIYRASIRSLNTWAKEGKIKYHTVRGKHAILKRDADKILESVKIDMSNSLKNNKG